MLITCSVLLRVYFHEKGLSFADLCISRCYLIKSGLQNFFNDSVIDGLIKGCPFHSFDQPLFSNLFFQAQNTYTTSVSLFWIIGLVKNLSDVIFHHRSNRYSPP